MGDQGAAELRAQVRRWLADDPDPASRAELRALLTGWPATRGELADRFAGPLRFGTAGLRGPLRAGPNGMNIAVVRAAAAGLVRWLTDRGAAGPLVIGYDARHGSRRFAEETARVATGAGRPAQLLPRPLPTPVLAHAVRRCGAAAGVMVTASHNPPQDNGYKVYLGAGLGGATGAGAQIASPVDAEIEAAIRAVGPLSAVPLGPTGELLDAQVVESYVAGAAGVVPPTAPRKLVVAYTPLHGVGGEVFTTAMRRAGFDPPLLVPAQADPDPDFPTVPFPNPEEPGAMDRVLTLAATAGADLAIAHDPDADRCAVAIPGRADAPATRADGWRMLTGDELGLLLADRRMRAGATGRYVTTVVSSSMLAALCRARGLPYAETLTGFKWITRADPVLAYGYEEALGYCVAPDLVRDKDGITAALLTCALVAELRAAGRTLADQLDELAAEVGVHETGQVSLRLPSGSAAGAVMATLRADPPSVLAGAPVTEVVDRLPEADLVSVRTDHSRLVVRPSGTEPKLKAYLEVTAPVTGPEQVAGARRWARATLATLHAEVAARLSLPTPSPSSGAA